MLKLPRLQRSVALTDERRLPTTGFIQWWQKVVETIETSVNDIIAILVAVGLAQDTADEGLTLAASAINVGGTIKDDKVLTDSMVDNAATVISSLFYNNAGGSVGTAGSYVDLPGGPAEISIATGTKATQQCFIDAWVGVRRGGGANDMVTFRCQREDATILAQTYTQEATNDQAMMPLAFLDPSPTASTTHTYTIEVNTNDAATEIREVFVKGFLGKTG